MTEWSIDTSRQLSIAESEAVIPANCDKCTLTDQQNATHGRHRSHLIPFATCLHEFGLEDVQESLDDERSIATYRGRKTKWGAGRRGGKRIKAAL